MHRHKTVRSLGLLAALLCLLPLSGGGNDDIIQHVQDGTDVAVGFDHLDSGPRNLSMTLQATGAGNLIDYSFAWDPAGYIIWTSNDSSQQQLEHRWEAQGVHGEDVNNTVFDGFCTQGAGGMGMGYFTVEVSHVDMDLQFEDGTSDWYHDDNESVTGVEMAVSHNDSTLPDTFPIDDESGRPLHISVSSSKGGTLTFEGTGAELAVYQLGATGWEKITAGISVPAGGLFDTFMVFTSNQFSGSVDLTARLQHASTALDAADVVKVVHAELPSSPAPIIDVDVDSDNDSTSIQYRPPSGSDAEDKEEDPADGHGEGMQMELTEGWARVEIRSNNIPGEGWLTVSSWDSMGAFEFSDASFSPIADPAMLYSGPVDASTTFPIVFHVRPSASGGMMGGMPTGGESITINADLWGNVGMYPFGGTDVAAVTLVAGSIVNLRIFNGQHIASGGSWRPPLSKSKKLSPGAFTVANINDTDGDGIADNVDHTVRTASVTLSAALPAGSTSIPVAASSPNPWHGKITSGGTTYYQTAAIKKAFKNTPSEIIQIDHYDATNQKIVLKAGTSTSTAYSANDVVFLRGRIEHDLMLIQLNKPRTLAAGHKVILKKISGDIKVWTSASKDSSEVTLPKTYTIADFPGGAGFDYISLWVEARSKSSSLSDIELKLVHEDVGGGELGFDRVKATGVWAEMKKVLHNKGETYTIWTDFTNPPKDLFTTYGDHIGLRPIDAKGVKNVIAMQYKVYPSGINAISHVRFDLTRRTRTYFWVKTGATVTGPIKLKEWPNQIEDGNDERIPEKDESLKPTTSDNMYVRDGPGRTSNTATHDLFVMRANFEEFMRVSFYGSKKPEGLGEAASRCSAYYKWHARHRLVKDAGKWKRSSGDAMETTDNDVAPDHITIGTAP